MGGAARNARCPCGSGKKYKHCCLGKDRGLTARRLRAPLLVAVAGVVGAVAVAHTFGMKQGFAVGLLSVLGAVAWVVLNDTPPPGGKGKDPGAINFGR